MVFSSPCFAFVFVDLFPCFVDVVFGDFCFLGCRCVAHVHRCRSFVAFSNQAVERKQMHGYSSRINT